VQPGWYGLVPAAGIGIINRALLEKEEGMKALEILGAEDKESRSKDFGGRRLVRVDGGYIVLNFIKYREKDHTNAERQRRFREKKEAQVKQPVNPRAPRQRRSGPNATLGMPKRDAEGNVI
jgi:hypothetical protein